jgi:hypothetical protein
VKVLVSHTNLKIGGTMSKEKETQETKTEPRVTNFIKDEESNYRKKLKEARLGHYSKNSPFNKRNYSKEV